MNTTTNPSHARSLMDLETSVQRATACIHLLVEMVSDRIEKEGWKHADNIACGLLQISFEAMDGLNQSLKAVTEQNHQRSHS